MLVMVVIVMLGSRDDIIMVMGASDGLVLVMGASVGFVLVFVRVLFMSMQATCRFSFVMNQVLEPSPLSRYNIIILDCFSFLWLSII